MIKVVITGSNGLLGQTLLDLLILDGKYQVHGVSRGPSRYPVNGFQYHTVDLSDKIQVNAALAAISPNFIINTAAMTHVDVCDSNREACDIINVQMVSWLVEYCKLSNAHLIHLSTDFVFDGKNGPYKETDTTNPISYYGLSKLRSEETILSSKINFTILRTILVYGLVRDMSRTNIVLWVLKSLKTGKPITVVHDQYRMPTNAKSLSEACKLAMEAKRNGIFHISSSRLMSVYQIAVTVAKTFGLNSDLISPISSLELNQPANRPPKTGFYIEKAVKELGFVPKTFEEELLEFKTNYDDSTFNL